MAIKLTNLEQVSKDTNIDNGYSYKDLHLDFSMSNNYNPVTNRTIIRNDISVDYDIHAIRNSLKNLFNTRPGQRFLFPRYGLDLYQFLFEPITPINADIIKDRIQTSIKDFEDRVNVVECQVIPNEDENEYNIRIAIEIKQIKKIFPLYTNMDLKTQSFKFLDTSPGQRIQ